MPFNGQGTFNVLETFQPNTDATAEAQNAQDGDIALGLSNCMTRDGQGPATNNLSMGGYKLQNLAAGAAATDAVNLSQLQALIPTGMLGWFYGSTAPAGWLPLTGGTYNTADYPALAAFLGISAPTFTLGNWSGRTLACLDTAGTTLSFATTIGAFGGEQTHQLTTAELAAHSHTDAGHVHPIIDPAHRHQQNDYTGAATGNLGGGVIAAPEQPSNVPTAYAYTGVTVGAGVANIQNTGLNTPHNNVQPTIVALLCIKT